MKTVKTPSPGFRIVEDVIGCKWTVSVLDAVQKEIKRPGALQRAIPGLTTKVMNERLKKLQRFRVLERRVYALNPLHVEYNLTRRGRGLIKVILSVRKFASHIRDSP